MNTRREFLVIGGAGLCLLGAPLASLAQQQGKVWRIGFLGSTSAAEVSGRLVALRAGLRELGYTEGRNIAIEYRWANDKYDRLPVLAAELVRARVDVILTYGTPGTRAAMRATATIPIVMASRGDAVATGLVASLARPGGNVTGLAFFSPEISAKRLEMLKEAVPRITQVAYLLNPDNNVAAANLAAMEATAKTLKMGLRASEARTPGEFKGAFAAMARKRVDAVSVGQDSMLASNYGAIAALAAKQRLASIGSRDFAVAGGLIGYGHNALDFWRRAAVFLDKIFKGTRPADLPIEQPTKFEMVINMKTAKALGITIPQTVLIRADRVIE